jgi:hypothetical protein
MVFKKDEPVIKKNFINRLVFFIGWVLSPFTFWNDAFINIPVAYITARLLAPFIHVKFATLVVVCYWLSNIAGLAMMYASGNAILRTGKGLRRELLKLAATMIVYTILILIIMSL